MSTATATQNGHKKATAKGNKKVGSKTNQPYQPLHHKYRPQRLDELVGQETVSTCLSSAIAQGAIAPGYLFTGSRGTGKTSSARILAKSLNCLSFELPTTTPCGQCEMCQGIANGTALDVIEIDAASNSGVDNMRQLTERAQFMPIQGRYKVFIIDECHQLSPAANNALLKTLEEPPKNVVFILATTDPQKLLATIISRCQRYDFKRISIDDMVNHLGYIAEQENIAITGNALTVIAQSAQGGMRDAESLLDQVRLMLGKDIKMIDIAHVRQLIGAIPEDALMVLANLLSGTGNEDGIELRTIEESLSLLQQHDPHALTEELLNLATKAQMMQVALNAPQLVGMTPGVKEAIAQLAQLPIEALKGYRASIRECQKEMKGSLNPFLRLENLILDLAIQ